MTLSKDELDALDPIVRAALIDDDDDEESKELTAQVLAQHGYTDEPPVPPAAAEDDDEEEDTKVETPSGDDVDEDEQEEEDDKITPPEAIDAPSADDVKAEEERLSRKERREQKRVEWLTQLAVAKQDDTPAPATQHPAYKPLDIKDDGEYNTADLIKDREDYAKATAAAATQAAVTRTKQIADEEAFWKDVEYKANTLHSNPKYAFLNAENQETYDEKKAAPIVDLYLKTIGYKETILTDEKGFAKLDAKGQPVKIIQTARKDLSYDDFVVGYMDNVMNFVDDDEAEKTRNIVKQAAHQGVRPGGNSRRGIGKLREGDISAMSDEDFEKNEAEIDRQIMAELGR